MKGNTIKKIQRAPELELKKAKLEFKEIVQMRMR